MSKEGMKLEICLFAAQVFGVDPAWVLDISIGNTIRFNLAFSVPKAF
jgi:hypothetical protein